MKTLYVAVLVGFVAFCASGCTGGSTLPALPAANAMKAHNHHAINPNACPGDTGGGMTGDGHPC